LGKILVVGFGPGSQEHITARARIAIQESNYIIGYNTYVDLIRELLDGQEVVRTGMTEEVSRAQKAVQLAKEGQVVAVISSGDAGVYGMAGLVFEVLIEQGWQEGDNPEVEVIPGISAMNSCAALLGAPIMHDTCTISLSDHLTPWEIIAKRVESAAVADFVIALYNPRSGRRTRQIIETQQILLKYRSPDTPVGLVKSAFRDRQNVVHTTLGSMLEHDIGMLTTVIIGNSSTFYHGNLMITPRGYQRKYSLDALDQRLRPGERLRPENEPWALEQGQVHQLGVDSSVRMLAEEALARLPAQVKQTFSEPISGYSVERVQAPVLSPVPNSPAPIFEVAVSPGVANKKFTSEQLVCLAQLVGEKGELEYTPAHQMILRTETHTPEEIVTRLREAGFGVFPVGDVLKVKACDFCDGEKFEGVPYAEEITRRLAGLKVEKELRIGYNGCAMACYGAVNEDIGVVFRKGKFDLFLGGKTTGRNATPGQRVAEGIPAEEMVDLLERIVRQYEQNAFPGERFHKFFKRVGEVGGLFHQERKFTVSADTVCGS